MCQQSPSFASTSQIIANLAMIPHFNIFLQSCSFRQFHFLLSIWIIDVKYPYRLHSLCKTSILFTFVAQKYPSHLFSPLKYCKITNLSLSLNKQVENKEVKKKIAATIPNLLKYIYKRISCKLI